MKNGFSMTTLNYLKLGQDQENQVHRCQNATSTNGKLCCSSDGIRGVLLIMLKSSEIVDDRYRLQLIRLNQVLKNKWLEWQTWQVDSATFNVRSHVAKPVWKYLEGVKWEILSYPPCSSDIALDFYLFWSLKLALSGERFISHESSKNWRDE